MSAIISITESSIFAVTKSALSTFGLVGADGIAIPIIRGQINRVPEPKNVDFVVMWPLSRGRLATNIDEVADTSIIGSIAGGVLIATEITSGALAVGQSLFSPLIALGTMIKAQKSGTPGGLGTYPLSINQNVVSGIIRTGTLTVTQYTEFVMQLDVHGPTSGDNAQRIATLLRDYYGVAAFSDQGVDIQPMYADDPKQVPFINGEQQYEERWVVDIHLQVNPVITVAQQFADQLQIATIEVESTYIP